MLLGQSDIPDEVATALADPTIVDRVFAAGPIAIVGVAFALVLYVLGKKALDIWKDKGTIKTLQETYPDRSADDLAHGYASEAMDRERLSKQINRYAEENKEFQEKMAKELAEKAKADQKFQLDMAVQVGKLETTIEAQDARLNRMGGKG